jgi:transitional endoplasmic reticulum ATPase
LEIFKIHTRKNPLAQDVSLQELVAETAECNGADIEAVCREATMIAIRRFLGNYPKEEDRQDLSKLTVTSADFIEALKKMKERKNSLKKNLNEVS